MSAQRNQKVVCILGMHRSGTSAVTRMANLIGIHLGSANSLRIESVPDNTKGHWEHKEIALINETILQRFGGNWHEPPLLPNEWEKSSLLDDLRNDARQLIEEQFKSSALWGWKDPRTCLTLPFWQQFVGNVHYVLCLRNPVDVASSLQQRDGLAAEKSFQLWFTYVCSALKHIDGKPRITIFFADTIRDPVKEIKRIAELVHQPESKWPPDALTNVEAFIESKLRHHSSALGDLTSDSSAERSAKELYLAQRICADATTGIEQMAQGFQIPNPRSQQLVAQFFGQDEIVQRLWAQIDEQGRALASQSGSASAKARELSQRLQETELELKHIKNTLGFRILRRCWQIKHKYLRPTDRDC
jgi:hypothetical protein